MHINYVFQLPRFFTTSLKLICLDLRSLITSYFDIFSSEDHVITIAKSYVNWQLK